MDETVTTGDADGGQRKVATAAELVAAREAKGLSQIDISQRIKLQMRQVSALEAGDWDSLPGRAFVRGALRSYAKLVDVDPSPLVDAVGGATTVPTGKRMSASVSGPETVFGRDAPRGSGFANGGRGRPWVWIVAGIVGAFALAAWFGGNHHISDLSSWLKKDSAQGTAADGSSSAAGDAGSGNSGAGRGSSSPSSGTASTGSAGTVAGGTDAAGSNAGSASGGMAGGLAGASGSASSTTNPVGTPGAGSSFGGPGAAPGASGTSAGSQPGLNDPGLGGAATQPAPAHSDARPMNDLTRDPSSAPPSTANAGAASGSTVSGGAAAAGADDGSVLRFTAGKADSWVTVTQVGDNKRIHNKLLKAGESVEVKGTPPFKVALGSPQTLTFEYRGQKQPILKNVKTNNIARMTVE